MKVGLFIPCYIDQFYPGAAIATLQLLERLGIDVVYPGGQTCCGQPMANSGFERYAGGCMDILVKNFSGVDYIVVPSGSCALHMKEQLGHVRKDNDTSPFHSRIFELTEFLIDVLGVQHLDACFPRRVGIHLGCHGQRGLKLSQMSELVAPPFSKPHQLLRMVKGIELLEQDRPDECCGFGGTFCVFEESVSVKMGKDRVADHIKHGAEVITSTDMSCLMHLEGILKRQKSPVQIMYLAEILVSGQHD